MTESGTSTNASGMSAGGTSDEITTTGAASADTLARVMGMVEEYTSATDVARAWSEQANDYYHGHQWSAEDKAKLRASKQPAVTNNRIKRKIDAMIGMEQRMRVDPKAHAREPRGEQAANTATQALVYVDDVTRFDNLRSQVFANTMIEGYGGVEIVVEERRGRLEVEVIRLRWEEIVFDPHSRELDFSDAGYIGFQRWMTVDAAVESFAGAWEGEVDDLERLLLDSRNGTTGDPTFEDRPRDARMSWGEDKGKSRIRVAQLYHKRRGEWRLTMFCSAGVIYDGPSPYLDEDGKPACAIELMSAYVDRENRRYGVVRGMIDQQDEINKRRSKLLHQLSTRQTMGVKGAVNSVARLKSELAKPDGHVEIEIDNFIDAARAGVRPFEIINQNDQIAGQFSLLEESKSEIDGLGPNPSLIGQTASGASGRAIMAQQQAGMAELAPLYDALRDWTVRCYRQMWMRIRQYWDDERWVRITGQDGQDQYIAINAPAMDPETGQPAMQMVMGPDGMPVMQPVMENVLADMDVDIMIEDVPDHVSLRHEEFEQLSEMAQRGIPIPPEMIIEASNLRSKGEMLARMKQEREQGAQAQAAQMQMAQQMAQMQQQLEAMKAEAEIAYDQARAAKAEAEVDETVADTEKTRVETRRMLYGQ